MQFDPVAEGEKIASSCIACHGEDGNSLTAGVPSLTGLHVKYLVAATQAYQEGARKSNVMATMISHLSDTDIEKVSYYFATRATRIRQATQEGDPLSGEKTSENCASCHGAKGVSSDPANPSLAGQDAKYLFLAIREYAGGKRAHEGMKNAVAELSEQDMRNVAAYYAAQTAVQPQTFLPELPAMIIEKKCNRCHGASGHSTEAGTPRLAGQMESYLVVAMKEYQNGTRKSPVMHAMSDVLSLIEIQALAAYYAHQ